MFYSVDRFDDRMELLLIADRLEMNGDPRCGKLRDIVREQPKLIGGLPVMVSHEAGDRLKLQADRTVIWFGRLERRIVTWQEL